MTRKKVLFLITKATWGGAQKYVFDLATNLPKEEFEPVVACGTEGKLAQDLSAAGVQVRHLPALGRDIAIISDIKSFFEILKTIREVKPDAIHLNSSKAAALGALAARIAGVPKIIFTVHGWPFKENRGVVSRFFIRIVSWLTSLLSHHVVVVSITDERIGKCMLFLGRKVIRIPLGCERVDVLPPSEGFRNMFGSLTIPRISQHTIRIVTIAELTRNKGIRYGIDTVKELTDRGVDSIYVVAGDGEDRETLIRYAHSRGVNDRVFFSGFVPQASRNLAGFDVFLLPSLKEGAPYVLLEATMVGLPIVATDVVGEGFAEQFPRIRIVPIADRVAIAEAIVELSTLPRFNNMRRDQFSLPEMIKQTVALYD